MVAWINAHAAWMLVNLKTSNNNCYYNYYNYYNYCSFIFFCHEWKATRFTTAKGAKGQSRFHNHHMHAFFQSWVKQRIIGKQSKKETKYFVSIHGMKYTPFLHIKEVSCLTSKGQWKE